MATQRDSAPAAGRISIRLQNCSAAIGFSIIGQFNGQHTNTNRDRNRNTHNPFFYRYLFMYVFICTPGVIIFYDCTFLWAVFQLLVSTRLFVLFLVDHFMASVRVFISLAVLKGFQVHVLH